MLEAFMKVAYERGRAREEQDKLAAEMAKRLSLDELKKLATGETKLAWHCDEGKETMDFLTQFEGTPLMAQALQLEEAGIQLEEQENQQRQMRHQQSKLDDMDSVWDKKSALGTQKKLLLIQLAKTKLESGAAGPPAPDGMMGMPPSATPPEPSANPGATAGMAAQESPMAGDAVKAAAAGWVREMAQREVDVQRMRKIAAMPAMLGNIGQAALGVARANKGALIGAGVGAASGAAAGGLGEHGSMGRALGGAVGGAAGGALLGGGAQIGMRANHLMNTKGMGAMEAIQGAAGRQLANTTGAVRKAMPAVAAPAAAAAQAAGGAASVAAPLGSSVQAATPAAGLTAAPEAPPLPDLRARGEAERQFIADHAAWRNTGEIGEPPMPPRHMPGRHVQRAHQQADQAADEILQNYGNQIRTNYGS